MAGFGDDESCLLVSDAQQKILKAKRDRGDKISKAMGEYLLKGWRMLAINCEQCDNILMRNRENENYCINCSELDDDTSKDDPAVSNEAAVSYLQENLHRNHVAPTTLTPEPDVITQPMNASRPITVSAHYPLPSAVVPPARNTETRPSSHFEHQNSVLMETAERLVHKLNWASHRLNLTDNVEQATQLCLLIRACSDALSSVNAHETRS